MCELQQYVDNVAEELEKLYEGLTDEERDECIDQGEATDLYDYIQNALDLEYLLNSNFELIGVNIYVTLGGPNVYVDTNRGSVVGHWGTDEACAWVPSEVCNEIEDIVKEYMAGSDHCPF